MATSRVISSGIRCRACCTRLLTSTVPFVGLDSAAAARTRVAARPFTTTPLRLSDDRPSGQPRADDVDPDVEPAASAAAPQAADATLPWYLQVGASQRPLDPSAHPLADRQRIPALPSHPPPILDAFLQFVSVDLGIDDLSLLDCRHLDPPAALGANLLMLFGTARSEKHLHVSADRLCRWLRSEHRLSPHADGLLGRNELKLKLKRKARRAKMLSNAGASEGSLASDDGIRSGWICVNVGSVAAAESTQQEGPEVQDFVGFGAKSDAVSIVLQLFTEEKRAELDLETLWNGVLKTDRTRKKMSTPDDTLAEAAGSMHNSNGAVRVDSTDVKVSNPFQPTNPQAPLQARAFHTARARANGTSAVIERDGKHIWANRWSRPRVTSLSAAAYSTGPPAGPESSRPTSVVQERAAEVLAGKLQLLQEMPPAQKMEALGNGYGTYGRKMTPFLQDFDRCIPEIRDVIHYEAILNLYIIAQSIDHPHYPSFRIYDLIQEMRVAGVRIPKHIFLPALRALLSCPRPDKMAEGSAPERVKRAFDLLYTMQGHSPPVLIDEVVLILHDSVCTPVDELEARISKKNSLERREEYDRSARRELLNQIDMLDIRLTQDSYAHLLRSYAILGDIDGMWRVWKSTAMAWHSRSAYMYALLLNGVAFSSNQKECIAAVRECVATMGQEKPPVELKGDVRDAIMRCLMVIDPNIDTAWQNGNTKGEWLQLWIQCMHGLKAEGEPRAEHPERPLSDVDMLGAALN